MRKFDLNSARTYVGHNVNLHLKDGAVIINVLVTEAQRSSNDGCVALHCKTPAEKKMKIPLREIVWAERLDPYLLLWH